MAKELKIWNGRGWEAKGDHLYICARNRKHAAQLMEDAYILFYNLRIKESSSLKLGRNYREISGYFSEGCWGNSMNDIEPEVGVWYSGNDHEKPVRII